MKRDRSMKTWRDGAALILIAAALLAGCATPTPAPAPAPAAAPGPTAVPDYGVPVVEPPAQGGPTATANYNTFIYGGPGTNYVVYGAFLGSQQAKVIGRSESGAWWAISVPPAPGSTGWVDGAWVTVTGADAVPTLPTPPAPPTPALVPPAAGDPQATALVNTNIRTGPAETFPAYGIAPAGGSGRVLGKSQDAGWWVVRLDPAKVGAGYGWVSATTVQASNTDSVPVIASPTPPVQTAPPAPAAGAPVATATDYVYVRSGAGTCFLAYGVAAPGATAEIAGKTADGQWWQVKISTQFAPDGLGWVSASYVTTANAGSVPVKESPPCSAAPVPPPATYACYLQSQDPLDYSALGPNKSFMMKWTLQNTGTSGWSDAVLKFVQAGANGKLHTGSDSMDVSGTVDAGATYDASVAASTPGSAGTYGELWQIQSGGTTVCEFWMIINVVQ